MLQPSVFFSLLLLLCTTAAHAQAHLKVNKHTVAYDSMGGKHPYKTWKNLRDQGYGVRAEHVNDPKTRWVLYKMSEAQKERWTMQKPAVAPPKKGDPFKPFATTDLNGNAINIADATDNVFVINFWFINCSPCRKEMPSLNKLVKDYEGDNKVQFYAIALDAAPELQKFLNETSFLYSIIPDGRKLAHERGIDGYPTNLVVKNGVILYAESGWGIGYTAALRKAVKAALQ